MPTTNEQTGLLQLLAIRDGTAPPAPIQELLDFDLVDVTEGTATFRYRPTHDRLLAEDGTLYAHATSTCLILQDSRRRRPSDAAVGSARADASRV